MISMEKNYRTRDGREVRIYAMDGGGYWPVHGAIQLSCSGWMPTSWDNDGNAFNSGIRDSLIEVRPRNKRTVWVNVYPSSIVGDHTTREKADNCASSERIACVKVDLDFEEGEGL